MGSHADNYMLVLVLIIVVSSIQQGALATHAAKRSIAYVKKSCISTTYPRVCYETLSIYAVQIKTSRLRLTKTALAVTLKYARSADRMISQIGKQKGLTLVEGYVVRDCIENVRDSIYEIQRALKALGHPRGYKRRIADVKTWVSAAVTDESTCMDAFDGMRVRPVVKIRITRSISSIAKLTSNALALVNKLS